MGAEKEGEELNGSNRISSFKSLNSILLPARNEIREENDTFNNITIIRTPKRKNERESTVSRLVGIFSNNTCNLPNGGESPAKRRRLWGQGH